MLEYIPPHLDYEEVSHDVNFRNVDEKTRKDIIYHYADKVPIFENGEIKGYKYLDRIKKVDLVSWLRAFVLKFFFDDPKIFDSYRKKIY